MKKIFLYVLLFLNGQFLMAQWETVAIFESTDFGYSDGWVGSDNGSPWDCSNVSVQKLPATGDFVYVPQTLATGYLYRYTYYVKAREPQVFCEFREGSDISAGGNPLPFAWNQQGETNYEYTSGSFDTNDAPAMVCGDEFKYTSGPVTGDGDIHYLKVVITDVQGVAFTKPLRVAHCVIERRIDNSYLFPLSPTDLKINDVSEYDVSLEWTDNAFNEEGFVIETSLNGGSFHSLDTVNIDDTTSIVNLSGAGSYDFRVYAYNGEGKSDYTNVVSTGIFENAPVAPSGFIGTAITSRRIDLEWTDNSDNENGFVVEVNAGEGYVPVQESPLPPNATSLSIFSLEPLTDYSLRLFSYNNIGSSDTLEISIQTPDPSSDGVVFPEDAGILNVRDFGAKGDGKTDDTEAILSAMTVGASRFVYFPIGTYLVSDRLEWPGDARNAPLILIGQDKEKCIIKLSDNNLQYQNPSSPRSVIWTQEMGSADNFRNFIRNLTINTGTGNPGAIGIRYMSNNMGSVSDVNIISADGQGVIGLDMAYNSLNGPLLISKVRIEGFDTGIKSSGAVNSQTLEHIILENQQSVGIENAGQVLSIRDIQTINVPLAIYNSGSEGVMTLIDGNFSGGSTENPAVLNSGMIFARNLQSNGYGKILENTSGSATGVEGNSVTEFTSHDVYTLFPWTKPQSLNLKIKDTPDMPWESDFSQWANVENYGAVPDDSNDDTPAIQDAINSGMAYVYFPPGIYNVSGSIELTGNVEKLIGMESNISVGTQAEAVFILPDSPGSPQMVEIQHLSVTPTNPTPAVNNASAGRTLIIRYCKGFGGTHTGTGEIFYEDVGTGVQKPIKFSGGSQQKAWIRQLSNEPREGATHFVNEGAVVWMLGHKTEMPGTLVETSNGGKTEICGAFAYSVGGDNSIYPMYVNDNSSMSVIMGGAFFASGYGTYNAIVGETQNGDTRGLLAGSLPPRAGFRMMNLYVGYPDDGTGAPPDAPTELNASVSEEQVILLEWTDNSYNEEGFVIEMKAPGGEFTPYDSVGANTINASVSLSQPLESGTDEEYCFRVLAYNELGNSAWSNEACATVVVDDISSYAGNSLSVKVYPNPFVEKLTMELVLELPSDILVEIFDITGRKISSKQIKKASGKTIIHWNDPSYEGTFDEGIYFVKVKIKDQKGMKTRTIKLVKK